MGEEDAVVPASPMKRSHLKHGRLKQGEGADAAFGMSRSRLSVLYMVLLIGSAGNTGLQSILPAQGRAMGIADSWVAMALSVASLLWMLGAPFWANRCDRYGRRRMLLIGMFGAASANLVCGIAFTAGAMGWLSAIGAFLLFCVGRTIYGGLGAAAPPAAQTMVAASTSRADRTAALSLLASSQGLGTIIGPALAPFLILPGLGVAGPGYAFGLAAALTLAAVLFYIPDDGPKSRLRAAASSFPALGGEEPVAVVSGAANPPRLRWRDPRVWNWHIFGCITFHFQAMVVQIVPFLTLDRLGLPPGEAQQSIGIVLMIGAGAVLLAQWGLIPTLKLAPRVMMSVGLGVCILGTLLLIPANSLYTLSLSYAIVSLGFGFIRPGYAAGVSLAVSNEEQAAAAGQVGGVTGSAFILAPSIGIALYHFGAGLAFGLLAGLMVVTMVAAHLRLRDSTL